ncbi:MAG: helix-turn-helix domain-containing protein [Oligoflexales bacterium]|nr:helix-turn-helix domain-containing protein [Oligoflexales bacterium]
MNSNSRKALDTENPIVHIGNQLFENQLGLMSVEDLARELGKSPKTIRNWVSKRQIPFVDIGRSVRFMRESIEAWLKSKEKKPCL